MHTTALPDFIPLIPEEEKDSESSYYRSSDGQIIHIAVLRVLSQTLPGHEFISKIDNVLKNLNREEKNPLLATSINGHTHLHDALRFYKRFVSSPHPLTPQQISNFENSAMVVIDLLFNTTYLSNEEICILLKCDGGFNPLAQAFITGNIKIIKKVLEKILELHKKEILSNTELAELFLQPTALGYSPLFSTIKNAPNTEVVKFYCDNLVTLYEQNIITSAELGGAFTYQTRPNKDNIVAITAMSANPEIMDYILSQLKTLTAEGHIKKLHYYHLLTGKNISHYSPLFCILDYRKAKDGEHSIEDKNQIFLSFLENLRVAVESDLITNKDLSLILNSTFPTRQFNILISLIKNRTLELLENFLKFLHEEFEAKQIDHSEYKKIILHKTTDDLTFLISAALADRIEYLKIAFDEINYCLKHNILKKTDISPYLHTLYKKSNFFDHAILSYQCQYSLPLIFDFLYGLGIKEEILHGENDKDKIQSYKPDIVSCKNAAEEKFEIYQIRSYEILSPTDVENLMMKSGDNPLHHALASIDSENEVACFVFCTNIYQNRLTGNAVYLKLLNSPNVRGIPPLYNLYRPDGNFQRTTTQNLEIALNRTFFLSGRLDYKEAEDRLRPLYFNKMHGNLLFYIVKSRNLKKNKDLEVILKHVEKIIMHRDPTKYEVELSIFRDLLIDLSETIPSAKTKYPIKPFSDIWKALERVNETFKIARENKIISEEEYSNQLKRFPGSQKNYTNNNSHYRHRYFSPSQVNVVAQEINNSLTCYGRLASVAFANHFQPPTKKSKIDEGDQHTREDDESSGCLIKHYKKYT